MLHAIVYELLQWIDVGCGSWVCECLRGFRIVAPCPVLAWPSKPSSSSSSSSRVLSRGISASKTVAANVQARTGQRGVWLDLGNATSSHPVILCRVNRFSPYWERLGERATRWMLGDFVHRFLFTHVGNRKLESYQCWACLLFRFIRSYLVYKTRFMLLVFHGERRAGNTGRLGQRWTIKKIYILYTPKNRYPVLKMVNCLSFLESKCIELIRQNWAFWTGSDVAQRIFSFSLERISHAFGYGIVRITGLNSRNGNP